MNKENCALKLVDEIILYYDARSKKHQITLYLAEVQAHRVAVELHSFSVSGLRKGGVVNFGGTKPRLEVMEIRRKNILPSGVEPRSSVGH